MGGGGAPDREHVRCEGIRDLYAVGNGNFSPRSRHLRAWRSGIDAVRGRSDARVALVAARGAPRRARKRFEADAGKSADATPRDEERGFAEERPTFGEVIAACAAAS